MVYFYLCLLEKEKRRGNQVEEIERGVNWGEKFKEKENKMKWILETLGVSSSFRISVHPMAHF